jgi:hypothetical protein
MANTTVSVAYFLSEYEQTVVSGTEKVVNESSPVTKYGLATTSTVSGNLWLYIHSKISTADNVTDWSGAGVWWQ